MNFQQYIKPELLILIPVLYLIGLGLKASAMSEKWTLFTFGALGVVLSCIYIFATSELDGYQSWLKAAFSGLTEGILVAGASVYMEQIGKQAKNPNDKPEQK